MTSQALNRPVDVIGVLDAAGANPYAEEGSPAWELARLGAAVTELIEALRIAVRQNSHDMLMTGDELRICEAALACIRSQP